LKLTEVKKGELFILTFTGAEKDKFHKLFDEFLSVFEKNGDED